MNSFKNKKGIIGFFSVGFVVTVLIIIILLIFILSTSIIKTIDRSAAGLRLYEEAELGITNVYSYTSQDYPRVVILRNSVDLKDSDIIKILEEKNEK